MEENEKTKDSRLAREFVVALPIEMGEAEWESLLTEFIKDNFVADGMCADVCIHDTDGHNPHAHIMVTVRHWLKTDSGSTRRKKNISASGTERKWASPAQSSSRP